MRNAEASALGKCERARGGLDQRVFPGSAMACAMRQCNSRFAVMRSTSACCGCCIDCCDFLLFFFRLRSSRWSTPNGSRMD